MADYNWLKMSPEEIENLFLTTEVSPNSPTGHYALQALEIKYKRMDSERSRRALWISIIALVISLVGIVVNAFGAEGRYLCVADMATGFYFDSQSKIYKQTSFNVSGKKYIVQKSEAPDAVLEIKRVGQKFADCYSQSDFHPEGGLAIFKNLFFEFRVNKRTGRYIHTHMIGYVNGDSEDDTPYIEIGKCSPF
jgi:hypothetical protein